MEIQGAVSSIQLACVGADLQRYLGERESLISPRFSRVLTDVSAFTSLIVRDGFEKTLEQLPNFKQGTCERPLIEVAEVIIEHHLRFAEGAERDMMRKSLLEAYIHAAGPRYVFDPPNKTRLTRSLIKWPPPKFAILLLSLHLFNVVSMAIQDKMRMDMPDIKRFELYMLGVETICRDAVKSAAKTEATEVDERWASSVIRKAEAQLLLCPISREELHHAIQS